MLQNPGHQPGLQFKHQSREGARLVFIKQKACTKPDFAPLKDAQLPTRYMLQATCYIPPRCMATILAPTGFFLINATQGNSCNKRYNQTNNAVEVARKCDNVYGQKTLCKYIQASMLRHNCTWHCNNCTV